MLSFLKQKEKREKRKMTFYDSCNFKFVEIDVNGSSSGFTSGKHLIPVHYRELGEKEGLLYDTKVSWSDVVINNVPLDQSCESEYNINIIKQQCEEAQRDNAGVIIVNDKQEHNDRSLQEVCESMNECLYEKKWMNRLNKMGLEPFNLPEAKKKKKSQGRYPVKPKNKEKNLRDELFASSFSKLNSFIDTPDCDISDIESFIEVIHFHSKNKPFGPSSYGWPGRWGTYCPPEHWVRPIIRWDLIWCEMDELQFGYKREFHFVDSLTYDKEMKCWGPAIFFKEHHLTREEQREVDLYWANY